MQTRVLALLVGTAWLAYSAGPIAQGVAKPAVTAPPPAAAAQATAGVRTVATVKQLMHAITIPASDAVFKAAGEPPKTEAGWDALRLQALALAESGNLLMVGSRVRDRADWMKMSRAMVDAGAGAATAAASKNADALSAASDTAYETCETCHAKYMKK